MNEFMLFLNDNSQKWLSPQKNYPLEPHKSYYFKNNTLIYPKDEWQCICHGCSVIDYDRLHCHGWRFCFLCRKKIWHNYVSCLLYSRRRNQPFICFHCRFPFHQQGWTSGEIHRMFQSINNAKQTIKLSLELPQQII
jgi:hypothetical protein